MSERWTSVSFSDSGVIPEDLESAREAAPGEKDLGGAGGLHQPRIAMDKYFIFCPIMAESVNHSPNKV